MKILLISFFRSNNIGDKLIGKQLLNLFNENNEVICVDFSNAQKYTFEEDQEHSKALKDSKINIKRTFWKLMPRIADLLAHLYLRYKCKYKNLSLVENIKSADAVILAGGNMVMDLGLYPTYTYKVYNILKIAKQYSKKTALLFTGAGPVQNKWQKDYVKKSVRLCDFVSVRDDLSKKFIEEIVPDSNIKRWNDPVFTLECESGIPSGTIGINVFFGMDTKIFESVKRAYVDIINKLRRLYPQYSIKLYSSEKNDYGYVEAVYNCINDDKVSVEYISSEEELIELYSKTDVVLAARMHSMIVSLVMRIPVVGLSWQAKVDGLAKIMDMQDRVFKINEAENKADNIVKIIGEIIENIDEEKAEIDKKVSNIKCDISMQVNKFEERF